MLFFCGSVTCWFFFVITCCRRFSHIVAVSWSCSLLSIRPIVIQILVAHVQTIDKTLKYNVLNRCLKHHLTIVYFKKLTTTKVSTDRPKYTPMAPPRALIKATGEYLQPSCKPTYSNEPQIKLIVISSGLIISLCLLVKASVFLASDGVTKKGFKNPLKCSETHLCIWLDGNHACSCLCIFSPYPDQQLSC